MNIGNEINQSVSYNVWLIEISLWHIMDNMNNNVKGKLHHKYSAVFESIKLSVSDNLQNQMKAYGAYGYSNRN